MSDKIDMVISVALLPVASLSAPMLVEKKYVLSAVKDAICLSSSDAGTFYGKTGTGRVDGQDVNGWFIGYIETVDNTYCFATNIGADSDATGGNATEITMSILSDMNIWK